MANSENQLKSFSRVSLFALAVALVAGVIALLLGGGAPERAPAGIPDPGILTGWAIYLLSMTTRVMAVLVIGFLLSVSVVIPNDGDHARGLAARLIRSVSISALIWSLSTVLLYFFTVSDVFAVPVADVFDWALLSGLFRDSSLGKALVFEAIFALLIAVLARFTLSIRGVTGLVFLALIALVPPAVSGHAAGAGAHDLAIFAALIHTAAATMWVGGLVSLLWLAWNDSKRLPASVARYSPIALWSIFALAISGVISAAIRIGEFSALLSGYGLIVIAKSLLLLVLAVFGAKQRKLIAMKSASRNAFYKLAGLEISIMALAMGLAVALARTPALVGEYLSDPVERILGIPLPPAPTPELVLWSWYPSGFGITVVLLFSSFYLIGLRVLRARGDAWPVGRTISWFVGLVIIAWATFGGLGLYSHVMFSAHMVSHMMLSMVAPIFLVLGAPVTLALRTLPGPRESGEVSPRLMLNDFLHSWYMRIITHPVTAAFIFAGSLYGVYFTNLFERMMGSHWGHMFMEFHFLAAGALFFYIIVGVDPAPRRLPPLARFAVLMITIPFHAFFAVAIMSASTVIAQDYFESLQRPYATDLLADQYLGGGIAWAMGEIPLLIVIIAIFVQWLRSDAREAKRLDRAAERDGDADLNAYNDYLAQLRTKTGSADQ